MIPERSASLEASEPGEEPATFTVASYNVHGCVGRDGRHDPERVAAVIRDIQADVVGLQEVSAGSEPGPSFDHVDYLAGATGMQALFAPAIERPGWRYGNALLTWGNVMRWSNHDVSVNGREPRSALEVDLRIRGWRLGCVVTHLGLQAGERREQASRLLDLLPAESACPFVLMGDFNEWRARARSLRELRHRFAGSWPPPRTFPASFPLFPLDRIWVSANSAELETHAHRSVGAATASDHLPLVARFSLRPARAEARAT